MLKTFNFFSIVFKTDALAFFNPPDNARLVMENDYLRAAEVTPDVASAVHRLRRQGLYVYNQQVLTLNTSLRFQTVANRIAMKKIGVDPYYTFYPKGKEENESVFLGVYIGSNEERL